MTAAWDLWRTRTRGVDGRWSLRVLGGGLDLSDDAEHRHPAASVIKLPILTTALDLVAAGQLGFDDRVAVRDDARGSGLLQYLDLDSVTLKQALTLMITVSDNVATNAVIDHLQMAWIQDAWRSSPVYAGFALNRLLGHPAPTPEQENYATAAGAVRLLWQLQNRADDPTSRFGLEVLGQQQFRDRIPSRLPPGVECLSKSGDLPGVRHDVALLRTGSVTVAVAMLASELPAVSLTTGGGHVAQIMGETAAAIVGDSHLSP